MRVWKLMAHFSVDAKAAFEVHSSLGYIAVGWTEVGDLAKAKPTSAESIRDLVKSKYSKLTSTNHTNGAASLWNFFVLAREGDYVIESAGGGKRLGVFRIVGPYEHLPPDQRVVEYAHARRAELTDIDADALWAACGGGAEAVAAGELHRSTFLELKVTPAAAQVIAGDHRPDESVRATAIHISAPQIAVQPSWKAWMAWEGSIDDWKIAGRGLGELCPGIHGSKPVSKASKESKPGRKHNTPALWVGINDPAPGLYRISFELSSDAIPKVACRVWVKDSAPEAYARLAGAERFVLARYLGEPPPSNFEQVTGILHRVELESRGQPGAAALRELFEDFIRYVLDALEREVGEGLPTATRTIGTDGTGRSESWLEDEESLAAIQQLPLDATEQKALVKVRIQQSGFRKRLLERWGDSCSVSGLKVPGILVASHIRPWSLCESAQERWSVDNGLLLHPGLDKAFDRGLIGFDDDGNIVLSKTAQRHDVQAALGIQAKSRIRDFRRHPGLVHFLRMHRELHAESLGE